MTMRANKKVQARGSRQAGFTLLETMIAVLVLSVGLLALAAMLGTGLQYMNMSQLDYIAQEKAMETVESIFTARDLGQATWSTICNSTSSVCSSGIFLTGALPLCDPGTDGIVGTADDFNGTACKGQTDSILLPSGNTVNATTANRIPLSTYNFQRTINITNVGTITNLRQIQVTITYTAGGRFQRTYTLTTNISNFS